MLILICPLYALDNIFFLLIFVLKFQSNNYGPQSYAYKLCNILCCVLLFTNCNRKWLSLEEYIIFKRPRLSCINHLSIRYHPNIKCI